MKSPSDRCPALRWLALALVALCYFRSEAGAEAAQSNEMLVYLGTYTGGKSQGIYVTTLDRATGQLAPPSLAAEVTSPSFLALHPSRPLLYAVNEVGQFGGKKSGAVSAFVIDRQTGRLSLLNQQPSVGDGPCHLNVDNSGRAVLVANYGGGSCAVLPIEPDGRLASASAFVQHRGSSVDKQRQEGPHAHGIYLDRANRFAFVPDLGLDQILIYAFDPGRGTLTPHHPPFAPVHPGSGPRHFAFEPGGRFAYAINEILCTITAFRYDADKATLQEVQTISTLPDGQSLLPQFSTAEIEVHPTGRFLYGSNRGHDTIAAFAIDATSGKLKPIQHESTRGKIPRGFGIDPSGAYLVAGNQESDSVVVFRIDPASGRLQATGQSIDVGKPVCFKFLPKE